MIKKLKGLLHNLLLSHATPHEVAFSFSLGLFIAFSPFLGFHTLIAVGLIFLLKKNEIAAIIGVWVNNPITLFPMFYAAYVTGSFLMGHPDHDLKANSLINVFKMGKEIFIPLLLGGTLLGVLSAIPSYFIVKKIYGLLLSKKEEWLNRLKDPHAR